MFKMEIVEKSGTSCRRLLCRRMDRESHLDIRIEEGRTNGSVECMAPKQRCWTAEQSVAYAFLNEFSISGSPKKVLAIEQYFKNAYATLCSVFQNLRLGAMWEITFARNSHAGLGNDFTKI